MKLTTYAAKKLALCLENRDLADDGIDNTDSVRTTVRDELFTEIRLNSEELEALAVIKRRYLKEVSDFYQSVADKIQTEKEG